MLRFNKSILSNLSLRLRAGSPLSHAGKQEGAKQFGGKESGRFLSGGSSVSQSSMFKRAGWALQPEVFSIVSFSELLACLEPFIFEPFFLRLARL